MCVMRREREREDLFVQSTGVGKLNTQSGNTTTWHSVAFNGHAVTSTSLDCPRLTFNISPSTRPPANNLTPCFSFSTNSPGPDDGQSSRPSCTVYRTIILHQHAMS